MTTYTIETRLDDGTAVDIIAGNLTPEEVPGMIAELLAEREEAGPGVIVGRIVIREEAGRA